jgi:hypothetical protein
MHPCLNHKVWGGRLCNVWGIDTTNGSGQLFKTYTAVTDNTLMGHQFPGGFFTENWYFTSVKVVSSIDANIFNWPGIPC